MAMSCFVRRVVLSALKEEARDHELIVKSWRAWRKACEGKVCDVLVPDPTEPMRFDVATEPRSWTNSRKNLAQQLRHRDIPLKVRWLRCQRKMGDPPPCRRL